MSRINWSRLIHRHNRNFQCTPPHSLPSAHFCPTELSDAFIWRDSDDVGNRNLRRLELLYPNHVQNPLATEFHPRTNLHGKILKIY